MPALTENQMNDVVAEFVTTLEEFIVAVVRNANSEHVEDAVELARKRAALTVLMIQQRRANDRRFQPRYDHR